MRALKEDRDVNIQSEITELITKLNARAQKVGHQ
jgi:hypothetical protein